MPASIPTLAKLFQLVGIPTSWLHKAIRLSHKKWCKPVVKALLPTSSHIAKFKALNSHELTDEDKQGITCPYVFAYPCRPFGTA